LLRRWKKRVKFGFIDVFSDAKYWRSIMGGLVCAVFTVVFPIIAMTRGALHNINVLAWDERILINLAMVFGAITAGAAYKTVSRFPSEIKEKKNRPKNLQQTLAYLKASITTHRAFLLLQMTVFLNTAAAVLCKRISVTRIGPSGEIELAVSTLGLLIFTAGGLLLGLSVIYRPLKASEKVKEATQVRSAGGNEHGNGGNGKGGGNGKHERHSIALSETSANEEMRNPEQQQAEEETIKISTKPLPLVQYPELSAWLIIIASISLVENAWMPLLGLPGILVGMKWYLSDAVERGSSVQYAGDGAQLDLPQARWKIVPLIY